MRRQRDPRQRRAPTFGRLAAAALLSCTVGISDAAASEDEGRPLAVSFRGEDDRALQHSVFDIVQTADDVVHIAVPDERTIMSYDGTRWRSHALGCAPSAMAVDSRDRLWIACSNDVGHLDPTSPRETEFVSSSHLLPPNIAQSWSPFAVQRLGDQIVFVDSQFLVRLGGERVVIQPNDSDEPFGASTVLDGSLFVARGGELSRWDEAKVLEELELVWHHPSGEITALTATQLHGDSSNR